MENIRFIKERKLTNLHIYVNANGWAAYDKVDLDYLEKEIEIFLPRINYKNICGVVWIKWTKCSLRQFFS